MYHKKDNQSKDLLNNMALSTSYQCSDSLPSCRGSQSELAQAVCRQLREAETNNFDP